MSNFFEAWGNKLAGQDSGKDEKKKQGEGGDAPMIDPAAIASLAGGGSGGAASIASLAALSDRKAKTDVRKSPDIDEILKGIRRGKHANS